MRICGLHPRAAGSCSGRLWSQTWHCLLALPVPPQIQYCFWNRACCPWPAHLTDRLGRPWSPAMRQPLFLRNPPAPGRSRPLACPAALKCQRHDQRCRPRCPMSQGSVRKECQAHRSFGEFPAPCHALQCTARPILHGLDLAEASLLAGPCRGALAQPTPFPAYSLRLVFQRRRGREEGCTQCPANRGPHVWKPRRKHPCQLK
mmetsp:Transcript_4069/g.7407  ORF Transcript_4069/g.7407 Transcript_4069/m.7407 type:complete len:203 (+) Transcript_4069:294-902(+)